MGLDSFTTESDGRSPILPNNPWGTALPDGLEFRVINFYRAFPKRTKQPGAPPIHLLGNLTADRSSRHNGYEIIGDSCDLYHGLQAIHRPSSTVFKAEFGVDPASWRRTPAYAIFHPWLEDYVYQRKLHTKE